MGEDTPHQTKRAICRTAFDQGITALVQEHRSSTLDTAAVLVTQIGNFRTQFLAAALVCVILLFTRQWRALVEG